MNKLSEKMKFVQRYSRLTFWNKVAFWGSLASIVALLIALLPYFLSSRNKVTITPREYVAHPLYQEFTAHVTNNYDYPIYDYSVLIMVKQGNLNVNTDLKLDPIEREGKDTSKIPIKAFGFGGISSKYRLSYMQLNFPSIEAHSTQKYLVKISGEKYRDKSIIEFSIGSYKRKPNPWYSIPIQPDKDGHLP